MKYPRASYLQDFKAIINSMLHLTTIKNNDYGGADDAFKNFQEFGEFGILVRMSDKWARIKTALWEKRELQVSDESIEDTIKDLAVYAIILLIWRKVHNGKPTPTNITSNLLSAGKQKYSQKFKGND